jgi:hypothetical protein
MPVGNNACDITHTTGSVNMKTMADLVALIEWSGIVND